MYEEKQQKSKMSFIFSCLFFAVFIFVMSSFIIRSCKMSDADIADDVIFNEASANVYKNDPNNFKVFVYDLEKRFESVDANQLLQLKYHYYIPSVKQTQITIKYNSSYAKPAAKDFVPFEIYLKDHNGDILDDYFYEYAEKDGYCYLRVAFNNVVYTDDSEYTLFIEQNIDNKTVSRGTFIIQKPSTASNVMKLDKKTAPFIYSNK